MADPSTIIPGTDPSKMISTQLEQAIRETQQCERALYNAMAKFESKYQLSEQRKGGDAKSSLFEYHNMRTALGLQEKRREMLEGRLREAKKREARGTEKGKRTGKGPGKGQGKAEGTKEYPMEIGD